jgi:hypothetical protein
MSVKDFSIRAAQVTIGIANLAVVIPSVGIIATGVTLTTVANSIEKGGNFVVEKTQSTSKDLIDYLESLKDKEVELVEATA